MHHKLVFKNKFIQLSNSGFNLSGSDPFNWFLEFLCNIFGQLKKNIMTLKTTKTIYWIGASLTSLWFGTSGVCELTKNPIVWDITLQLGYPAYFIYVLGVAKLAGIVVLLIPNRWLRLKEWVFAGVFFDIIFAFCSKLIVIGPLATIDAIIAFGIVTITYLMFQKLYPTHYSNLTAI
ncbi:hypothetical protein SRABI27_00047 [Pedobacter sp. Bi27]|nr:hypothetical protein SRABI27_00047 [Pedobacter sp. Bi27]